jgi:hypothetical protein
MLGAAADQTFLRSKLDSCLVDDLRIGSQQSDLLWF